MTNVTEYNWLKSEEYESSYQRHVLIKKTDTPPGFPVLQESPQSEFNLVSRTHAIKEGFARQAPEINHHWFPVTPKEDWVHEVFTKQHAPLI